MFSFNHVETPKLRLLSTALLAILLTAGAASAEQVGSIRGAALDEDFDVPLAGVQITIAETGEKITATDEGNFVFGEIPAGVYTLVYVKDGYARQVQNNVVVSSGQMTDVDVSLSGEFTEMEEFVVQDLEIGGGTEVGLLNLRLESPALLDSVSADLISQAGASDAAGALNLIAGATVQDGKFAVVRGLPDRYVNSQLNAIRLPTADADKRAVQLDQFPTEVIESVQVSKTFTPDQQGDASGGAVNVVLKGIPDETVFKVKSGTSFNTQATGNKNFLTNKGNTVSFWGVDRNRGDRNHFSDGGPFGVIREDVPGQFNENITIGGKRELFSDITVGGFANTYYKRSKSYFDGGVDDALWVENPGGPLTPETRGDSGNLITKLYDKTEASEEIQRGGLAVFGIETEHHAADVLYMQTLVTENKATLAEDTRGKKYYFPDHNPNDLTDPGNSPEGQAIAPYNRLETQKYTERATNTLQFQGKHTLPLPEIGYSGIFTVLPPELDWNISASAADLHEPDKRQSGFVWYADSENPGIPFLGIPPFIVPGAFYPLKPGENINFGNIQRIWKDITEESDQYAWNWKVPFEQWNGKKGYMKMGKFHDETERDYDQDTYSNFGQDRVGLAGDFPDPVSEQFPSSPDAEDITDGSNLNLQFDVDYKGKQEIDAWYWMADMPVFSFLNIIGGLRYEDTDLSIVNLPEENATYVNFNQNNALTEFGPEADAAFKQEDVLPSLGFVLTPLKPVTVRGSYTETVARQTFKELSPIVQQEYAGGDIFVGNPGLRMSGLENWDVRVDYTPFDGSLVSFSWFRKDIKNPIEYVKDAPLSNDFAFTKPVNFPKGKMNGFEFEVRQQMGQLWNLLDGLTIGSNLTLIDSQVILSEDQKDVLRNVGVDMSKRDMLNAPEYLYNINATYSFERTGTEIGLFFTVKGDTLVVGAGQTDSNFIPDVYAKEFGTLNLSVAQKIGDRVKLTFKAKNLLNPKIQEIYRAQGIPDTVKTAYKKGIDFTLDVGVAW